MRTWTYLLAVLIGSSVGCSSFGSAGLAGDAGTATGGDAAVTVDDSGLARDAAPEDAGPDVAPGPLPFCQRPENKTAAFCDDFDANPTKVDLLGWERTEDQGAKLSYNRIALSAPFAVTATVVKGTRTAGAFATRKEDAGKRFHLRFQVMGDGEPETMAPLDIAHVTVGGVYDLVLRAHGDGARIRLTLSTIGSTSTPLLAQIDQAPPFKSGTWIPVDVVVDAKSYRVEVGGKVATGAYPSNLDSPPGLALALGIKATAVPANAITKDTTLHYDDVVIEAER